PDEDGSIDDAGRGPGGALVDAPPGPRGPQAAPLPRRARAQDSRMLQGFRLPPRGLRRAGATLRGAWGVADGAGDRGRDPDVRKLPGSPLRGGAARAGLRGRPSDEHAAEGAALRGRALAAAG